jgi:hypothetical protein
MRHFATQSGKSKGQFYVLGDADGDCAAAIVGLLARVGVA